MIPEYFVCQHYTANLDHYWCTYSDKPGQDMRRVCTKALPGRQTQLEALLDLRAWLERRFYRGDNYSQVGKQITRVAGEIAALQREAGR